MRRRLTLLLVMLVVLSLAVALPAEANKPAPKLTGPMDIAFDPDGTAVVVTDP
jgi:DNA-binding beta-propeller fold protein YncE